MLRRLEENVRARVFYEALGLSANGKIETAMEAKELCYEKTL